MATKIKFVNGTVLEYRTALETEEFWGGASRRTLTFEIDRDAVRVDELDALCTEENTARLVLVNEEMDVSNVYDGYSIKIELGIRRKLTAEDTGEAPAQNEEYISIKLGKRTYTEQRVADYATHLDDVDAALTELAELIG